MRFVNPGIIYREQHYFHNSQFEFNVYFTPLLKIEKCRNLQL